MEPAEWTHLAAAVRIPAVVADQVLALGGGDGVGGLGSRIKRVFSLHGPAHPHEQLADESDANPKDTKKADRIKMTIRQQ
jgi:hypothetical protein